MTMLKAQTPHVKTKMYPEQVRSDQIVIGLPCLLCLHSALNCRAVCKWRQRGKRKLKKPEDSRQVSEIKKIQLQPKINKHCSSIKSKLKCIHRAGLGITSSLCPHSHQRRPGWRLCHWQKSTPRWSGWTSASWSSESKTSGVNGHGSSRTLRT